jgi:hypothetical protein
MKRIMKALKRTSKKTAPKPEDFKTEEEAHEAMEEYIKSKPVYTILNFFIGDNVVDRIKSNVDGKPPGY